MKVLAITVTIFGLSDVIFRLSLIFITLSINVIIVFSLAQYKFICIYVYLTVIITNSLILLQSSIYVK